MTDRRVTNLLFLAALAIACATLGVAWVLDPWFAPSGWPMRLIILAGGMGIILAVLRLAFFEAAKAAEAAQRYVSALCDLDAAQLQDESALSLIPVRKQDQKWRELCQRLRERLAEFARRAGELEMARASVEVRIRRLEGERDQLQEILRGLSDPVLAIDPFGDIVVSNPSAEKLLNIQQSKDSHPALEQLTRCEELVQLLADTRRRKGQTQRCSELSLNDSDGKQHWYRVTCRTLAAKNDIPVTDRPAAQGAVAVLTDISSLKAIQKRNAEFVSSVSHEMKTPLSSIRAYVELLVDGDAEDETTREEFLNVINNQADRLQRLVDNLLNLARIEAGVVAVNKAPLSLNELLAESVRVLEPTAESKRITLTSDISPLYLGVLADRDMLLQAAINLISNSLKYTHQGGSVTVRSRLSDKDVIFEVEDTGVGLSPEDKQRVFEKFYRVKKDREMAQGTGLGLPLVKHIVEDVHGGRIEVDSELGKGSTFRVIIPGQAQMSA